MDHLGVSTEGQNTYRNVYKKDFSLIFRVDYAYKQSIVYYGQKLEAPTTVFQECQATSLVQ